VQNHMPIPLVTSSQTFIPGLSTCKEFYFYFRFTRSSSQIVDVTNARIQWRRRQ